MRRSGLSCLGKNGTHRNERSKVVRSQRRWREQCTCHEAATGRRVPWVRKDRLPQAGFSTVASTSGLGQGDAQEHTSRGVWRVVAPAVGTTRRVTDTWPGPLSRSSSITTTTTTTVVVIVLTSVSSISSSATPPATFPPARNDTCQSEATVPSDDFCGRFHFKLFYFLLCHVHFFFLKFANPLNGCPSPYGSGFFFLRRSVIRAFDASVSSNLRPQASTSRRRLSTTRKAAAALLSVCCGGGRS